MWSPFFTKLSKNVKMDILDNLLKSQTDEGTVHLSQTELISNLWIFFLAGHETTSSVLTSECICLAKYPDIQEKYTKKYKIP